MNTNRNQGPGLRPELSSTSRDLFCNSCLFAQIRGQKILAVAVKFNLMTDRFRYYLRVRYGECDAQKVVFNARYADYIDITVMEFMRSMGYEQDLVDGTIDYQLVKQTLEWKAPARFDQVLEVSMYTK